MLLSYFSTGFESCYRSSKTGLQGLFVCPRPSCTRFDEFHRHGWKLADIGRYGWKRPYIGRYDWKLAEFCRYASCTIRGSDKIPAHEDVIAARHLEAAPLHDSKRGRTAAQRVENGISKPPTSRRRFHPCRVPLAATARAVMGGGLPVSARGKGRRVDRRAGAAACGRLCRTPGAVMSRCLCPSSTT